MRLLQLLPLLLLPLTASADDRAIGSKSLATCMTNSSISASTFDVLYTPVNNSFRFNIAGVSTISGNVTAQITVEAYGYQILSQVFSPCDLQIAGMCPMSSGQKLQIKSTVPVPGNLASSIPNIAYMIPDLDGTAKIALNLTDGPLVGCVEAFLYNGKTVLQPAVQWATAVIVGGALIISAIMSGLGHSKTAAHVAASSIALFGWFQSQAIYGMSSVTLPPIAASWTQNFQWSMGIIRLQFMQNIFTWYIKSTGGTPSTFLDSQTYSNVVLQKFKRSLNGLRILVKRADIDPSPDSATVFHGIKRVAYRAGIEETNLFMTGYGFFLAFVVFVALGVLLFKGICELATKLGWMRKSRFVEVRSGWRTVLKGIMYRVLLIGYTQMTVLSLWELVQRDSIGAVVNAIVMFLVLTVCLGFAAYRVIRLARRSMALHKNPAYILYSDPQQLNRWGFIYVQYRATAYWFIVPLLVYTFLRGAFIAFMQPAAIAQAFCLLVVELSFLVLTAWLKPCMDRRTNIVAISIASFNLVNSIIYAFFFSEVIPQIPALANGVLGVVFFVMNAVFSLVLLIFVIVSCILAVVRKNPDSRYAPMQDDRASYIKTVDGGKEAELDALAMNVRGGAHSPTNNGNTKFERSRFDTSDSSYMGTETDRNGHMRQPSQVPLVSNKQQQQQQQPNQDMWKQGVGYD